MNDSLRRRPAICPRSAWGPGVLGEHESVLWVVTTRVSTRAPDVVRRRDEPELVRTFTCSRTQVMLPSTPRRWTGRAWVRTLLAKARTTLVPAWALEASS